jgi:hypothetical protein
MLRIELMNLYQDLNSSKTTGVSVEDSIKWIKIKREWNKKIEESQALFKDIASENNVTLKEDGSIDTDNTEKDNLTNYNKSINTLLMEKLEFDKNLKLTNESLCKIKDLNEYSTALFDLLLTTFGNEI